MATAERQLREQMSAYGSRRVSAGKQINILQYTLQKIQKENLSSIEAEHVQNLLDIITSITTNAFYNDSQKLPSIVRAVKKYIEDLESKSQEHNFLALLQQHGVYRMLYHVPKLKAQKDDSGLMEALKAGFVGVAIAAVFVALFVAVPFLALPAWVSVFSTGLFAASVAYVSTLIYGLINDYYATKASLPYFLLGHQPQQHSLLSSNDPLTQSIVWGVAATFFPGLLASIAFGIAASVTAAYVPRCYFYFPIGINRYAFDCLWCGIVCTKKSTGNG